MRLLLIRHGQTPANVLGQLSTAHPGPDLTPLGRRQAAALPEALEHERIDALYVSTLLRTQLTVQPLADALQLPVTVLDGVHEIEAGDLEGSTRWQDARTYLQTVFTWRTDLDARMPGGPSGREFFDRFDASVARVADEVDGTAVIVSHGAAIRVWAGGRGRNVSPEFSAEHDLDNTGIVVLEGDPASGWIVESWQGEPVAGPAFADPSAADPTGEAVT